MKLLVTGGAGFIGSNFIHYILKTHPEDVVINLDLLTYAGNYDNLIDVPDASRHRFVHGDIADYELVSSLTKDVECIVHFAAESHVDRAIVDSTVFLKTNILGTANLLRVAREQNVPRFHHVSTDEVFGQLGATGSFNETSAYAPRNPYSASKAGSDHLVRSYYHTYGLPITISNCSNNYGPRQFPEKYIPLAITNIIQNKKIPVYGEGKNVRDWLHVDDHVRAIDVVIRNGKIGETYCIGGGQEMRNIDIAHLICSAFGKDDSLIEFVQDRQGHDYRYAIDASKIASELGWSPEKNFQIGINETISWYRQHEDWWKDILSDAYQQKNNQFRRH